MTNIILKKYPKDSAAAQAVMLAKTLSKVMDRDPIWYEGWILDGINNNYEQICNGSDGGNYILERKNGIENYGKSSSTQKHAAFLESMFYISAALYYSIKGDERAAWLKLMDASWHAGIATKREEVVDQIETAKAKAVSDKSREAALKFHLTSLKTDAKTQIQTKWGDWQKLAKNDPQAAKAQYTNKTAFVFDMLDKYPILAGSKSHNPDVILGWIRLWEKPKKTLITKSNGQ